LRRLRIVRTESFRLAALFAVLFLGLAGVLMGLTYWIVESTQRAELERVIDADIGTIENGFREKGIGEAVEVVQQRLGSAAAANSDWTGEYIYLADSSGRRAGNLDALDQRVGLTWLTQPHRSRSNVTSSDRATSGRTLGLASKPDAYGHGTVLGKGVVLAKDVYLFVGRDTKTIVATRTRLIHAFGWVTAITIFLAAAGGSVFSVQFLRRIDAIATTCNAIVAGRFNDRIALRGNDDELDRLAGSINIMLDRISELLENLQQVSSDIAHDLRTPLTHLRKRLEDARDKSTTVGDYSTAVTRAVEDTDELLRIFSALLRISQIDAGTRLAAFRELSLSGLLKELCAMYVPVAEDEGKSLRQHLADNLILEGDHELLTQLFSNLIENALRHTPAGTQILVSVTVLPDAMVASVADSGSGIPEHERAKVLRRFYRLSGSRSSRGYGLGLSLVNSIANLHGAQLVLADNSPGLKATVSFPRRTPHNLARPSDHA